MADAGTDEPGRPIGPLASWLIGINLAFLVPYLYLLPAAFSGWRGSGVFGLLLLPVLFLQVCIGVLPGLHRRKELGALRPVIWITVTGSLLTGGAAAALLLLNEAGC